MGDGRDVVVAQGHPAALAPLGVRNRTGRTQLVPDGEGVGQVPGVHDVEVGRPVLDGRSLCHRNRNPLTCPVPCTPSSVPHRHTHPSGLLGGGQPRFCASPQQPRSVTTRRRRTVDGTASCRVTRTAKSRDAMTATTGHATEGENDAPHRDSPSPIAGAHWRWATPRRALLTGGSLVAGGAMAAGLGLGVAAAASSSTSAPSTDAPGGTHAPTGKRRHPADRRREDHCAGRRRHRRAVQGHDAHHRRLLVRDDLRGHLGPERCDHHVQRVPS